MKRFRRVTAMLLSMVLFFGSTSAVVFADNSEAIQAAVTEAYELKK